MMPKTVEKKPTPLLMILVLIASITPLSLKAVGIDLSFTAIFSAWGRAVSFASCVYQPALFAQVMALSDEFPCDKAAPQPPAGEQLACNPDQITIDGTAIEELLGGVESASQPLAGNATVVAVVQRTCQPRRDVSVAAARRLPAATGDGVGGVVVNLDELLGEVVGVTMAEASAAQQRNERRRALQETRETAPATRYVAMPAGVASADSDFSIQVRAAIPAEALKTLAVERAVMQRKLEKMRVLTVTCDFKALKAFYEAIEAENGRAQKSRAKAQAKGAPRLAPAPPAPRAVEVVETAPEPMQAEF